MPDHDYIISWVNMIYGSQGLATLPNKCQLLLWKAPQNIWKYFKVIWKSQGILFCLTCGNPARGPAYSGPQCREHVAVQCACLERERVRPLCRSSVPA